MDIHAVTINQSNRFTDALGVAIGDGFEQCHRLRGECLKQAFRGLESEYIGFIDGFTSVKLCKCVTAFTIEFTIALYSDQEYLGRCGSANASDTVMVSS